LISAIERLRALRAGQLHSDAPATPETTVADLTPDWRVEFEERAAIREYDGGQYRFDADRDALVEIIARMRAAGLNPKKKLESI